MKQETEQRKQADAAEKEAEDNKDEEQDDNHDYFRYPMDRSIKENMVNRMPHHRVVVPLADVNKKFIFIIIDFLRAHSSYIGNLPKIDNTYMLKFVWMCYTLMNVSNDIFSIQERHHALLGVSDFNLIGAIVCSNLTYCLNNIDINSPGEINPDALSFLHDPSDEGWRQGSHMFQQSIFGAVAFMTSKKSYESTGKFVALETDLADKIPEPSDHKNSINFNFFMNIFMQNSFRKLDDIIYKPILLKNGTSTRCYEIFGTIEEVCYSIIGERNSYNHHVFDNMLNSPGSLAAAVSFIQRCHDNRLPQLKRDRLLRSFTNGILDIATLKFYTYVPTPGYDTVDKLPTNRVACKFQNKDYPLETMDMNCMEIPTPDVDKILIDQDFGEYEMFWLYALFGRMLFDIGTLEDWQVALFIKGIGGSGKSTLFNIFSCLFDCDDLAYMMSDNQQDFGDEHLLNRFVVLAMDLGKKTNKPVSRMNSFISGEHVSVNRKFKTAINMRWIAPIGICSNHYPPYNDAANSLMRRFVMFLFENSVKGDNTLFSKCKDRINYFLAKILACYHAAVNLFGDVSLWSRDDILPEMCHRAKHEYMLSKCVFTAFLHSDRCQFDISESMTIAALQRMVTTYASENNRMDQMNNLSFDKSSIGHITSRYSLVLGTDGTITGICPT